MSIIENMADNFDEIKIKEIEKEIRETPYHKGTERHIGLLRARLAKLKDKTIDSQSKKGGGGGGYAVKKQGSATVVLVGPPSAGKSTLINALTNAESKVAPYSFTTVSVIPGMMKYRDAYIQILDVPGLIEGAEEGKGRGREVLSVARGADLMLIITDILRPEAHARISKALERNGIRINKEPPRVRIEKKISGGLMIKSNIKQELPRETIKEIANEFGIKSAEISIQEKLTLDTLIDSFSKNKVYIPTLYVFNKADLSNIKHEPDKIYISAEKGDGLGQLKEKIWESLSFIVVYLVKRDEKPGVDNPMIMKKGNTLKDLLEKIGTDFAETHSKAKIWGPGSKFPEQEVSLKTVLTDGMMIRFI